MIRHYQETTKYSVEAFDYDTFWDWCRDVSKDNYIFVSEYSAPDDFECVWSKEHLTSLDCKRGNDASKKIRREKLFIYKEVIKHRKY